jgi:hypothetical protein
MRLILKASLAVVLLTTLAACNQTVPVAKGSGLKFDIKDDCVTRIVRVYDEESGTTRPLQQRFCGGAAQIAE